MVGAANLAVCSERGRQWPFQPEANGDLYIANSAPEFRQTILEGIHAKTISVPLEEVDELARRASSEAYVVRGFKEAWLSGEITEKDLKKFPFYCNYREYFEKESAGLGPGVGHRRDHGFKEGPVEAINQFPWNAKSLADHAI
jgi:hypothetical protein